jgi:Flp pilus assembly protein TadD
MIATVPSIGDKTEFRSLEQQGFALDIAAVEPTPSRQSVRIERPGQEAEAPSAAIADTTIDAPPASDLFLQSMILAARRDLQRYPSNVRVRANLGAALLNGHAVAEAVAVLSEGDLAKLPDRPLATLLATALNAAGRADEAERILISLQSSDPSDVVPLAGLAEASMRRGDYSRANEYWEEICKLRPESSPAHFNRGITLLLLGPDNRRTALKALRAAARMDPRRAAFHQGLGVGYALAGEADKAANSFQTALHLDPSDVEALSGLVKVLVEAGRSEEASAAARRHAMSIPGDIRPLEILAWALVSGGDISGARSELFKAFSILHRQKPECPADVGRVANNLGVCSALERDWTEARRFFERSVASEPADSPVPYLNLATAHLQMRQRAHSLSVLKNAAARFPESDVVVVSLAQILVMEQRHDDMVSVLSEWLGSGRSSPKVYSALGVELCDQFRRFSDALAVLSEGRAKFPSDALLVNNLAYAQLMSGETKAAAETLDTASSSDLETSICLTATRGLLLIRQGLLADGTALYHEAANRAAEVGRIDLASQARQKMHLEIARFNLEHGKASQSLEDIDLGLSIRPGRPSFVRDLQDLRASTH